MARPHLVKCLYCGETFDTNVEPFVKPNATRYAHQKCAEEHEKNMTQEDIEEVALYDYIKKIYGKHYNFMLIKKQIEKFKKQGYSCRGMRLSLQWFYEVKGNSIQDSNGGIGIIPYVFEDAKKYFYQLYLAKLANAQIKGYRPRIKEIFIPSPQIIRRPPRLFNLEGDE